MYGWYWNEVYLQLLSYGYTCCSYWYIWEYLGVCDRNLCTPREGGRPFTEDYLFAVAAAVAADYLHLYWGQDYADLWDRRFED